MSRYWPDLNQRPVGRDGAWLDGHRAGRVDHGSWNRRNPDADIQQHPVDYTRGGAGSLQPNALEGLGDLFAGK